MAAAVAYGVVSHAVSGTWNLSLAFVIGAVAVLALSGFRARSKNEAATKDSSVQNVGAASCRTDDKQRDFSLARQDAAPTEKTDLPAQPQPSTSTSIPSSSTASLQPAFQPPGETAEELWNRARKIVHNVIPDPNEDAEYLDLVVSAAERGYIPALAKVGNYAFRRGAFVEAYFWTTMAKCRQELSGDPDPQGRKKEIDDMLYKIRREWTAAGQPPEFENVYENFPEERGELGRAFLRLDAGIEVAQTRDYLRVLAKRGNPDAALFARCGGC